MEPEIVVIRNWTVKRSGPGMTIDGIETETSYGKDVPCKIVDVMLIEPEVLKDGRRVIYATHRTGAKFELKL
jgi:hypothetical protein